MTLPELGSRSPPRIFMNVDLPQPFAPIRPYRLPSPNLTEIFSKRGFGPNCMVMLAVDSTARVLGMMFDENRRFYQAFDHITRLGRDPSGQFRRAPRQAPASTEPAATRSAPRPCGPSALRTARAGCGSGRSGGTGPRTGLRGTTATPAPR